MDKVAVKTFMREFLKIHNILQYLSQYPIEYCNILQYDFSGDIHPYCILHVLFWQNQAVAFL
jgi:hypothetical protein